MDLTSKYHYNLDTNDRFARWIGAWVFLSANLVLALYVSLLCIFRMASFMGTTAPVENYFWPATISVGVLLGSVLLVGYYAAHQLGGADRVLRHALHSVKEGDLSTRVNLSNFEGCESLEAAFNDTMEVVEHRIKNG